MQASELITKGDLNEFKSELLTEIKRLVQLDGQRESKKWLKSNEVRKLLKISPGTLQNLRINGTLSFTRIGSIMYYKLDDINKLLEGGLQ
ncbi:helix-turn-helix domain-containing protein [Mucilaginibacter sp. CAU 1740]|uniref:helix-turn-helix domain-containing protein n=1 Tax=Mucilaginibacter sp. CAU 1740 TaxID=3140365 RepID=UPI00325AA9DE